MPIDVGWKELRALGTSGVFKSSYWWIILVPLAAKTIIQLPNTVSVFGMTVSLPIELPFSWKAFYYASLAFGSASLIFKIRCPSLIANYSDGQDFLDRGGHSSELRNQIRAYLSEVEKCPSLGVTSDAQKERSDQFRAAIERHMQKPAHPTPITNTFDSFHFSEGAVIDAFADASLAYNSLRPVSRRVCLALYVIGFVFFLWILIQNFLYVLGAS